MKRAAFAFVAGLLALCVAVAVTFLRGEATRDRVEVVEKRIVVDPCAKPKSKECQRRIRLVLRALVRRHPDVLSDLGLTPRKGCKGCKSRAPVTAQGGGALSPQGNGPIGRVRPPRPDPPSNPPNVEPPEPPRPTLDLDAPLPVQVCTDLLGVNC